MANTIIPRLNLIPDEDIGIAPTTTYKINTVTGHIDGMVNDVEALKQYIWKSLSTKRYQSIIYSPDIGVDDVELDKPYLLDWIQKEYRETLLIDDRIIELKDFRIDPQEGWANIYFIVDSVYGEFEMRVIYGRD